LAAASDDIKAFMGKIHPQVIDWALVAANVDKWVEKVELEFIR
jgi:iron(III) transport system substrate-binding protein